MCCDECNANDKETGCQEYSKECCPFCKNYKDCVGKSTYLIELQEV